MAKIMTLKEKAKSMYENHWNSPWEKDIYYADDMKRAYEAGGEFVLEAVLKWLKDGGYFVNNTETKKDLIKAIKGVI